MSQAVTKKVVLITGGSSGIGEASALEFAKLGHQVAITGLEQADLDRVLGLLVASSPTKSNQDFLTFEADFADPSQVEGLVEATVAKFGQLDVLVNNAGFFGRSRRIVDQDFYQDYQTTMQVNLNAAVRLSQLATPHLLKTRGVIINLSSSASRLAFPTISYSMSKAGISMLTDCLANAFDGTGVRAVAVAPGPVRTNIYMPKSDAPAFELEGFEKLVPLGRVAEPIDIANTIVFLASDKASYINGCTVSIDGGFMAKFGGVFSTYVKPIGAEE